MMVFWAIALLLMATAMVFLIPPLLQKTPKQELVGRDGINIMLHKDQMKELEADLESGDITQDQYDQARHDLERSLLQDVSPEARQKGAIVSTAMGSKSAIVIAVAVPLLAIALYNKLGAGEVGLDPKNASISMRAEGHQGTIEEQISQLQERIQTSPDDVDGWDMLARSYRYMKQYQAASDAFARAVALTGERDPRLLVDYADALAMASDHTLAGRPYDLVKKALTIQPDHRKALWLAATATYQAKDYQATLDYWEILLKQFPQGSDNYKQMLRNMGEVRELLGMPVDDIVAKLQAPTAASRAAISDNNATSVAASNIKISGTVSLDSTLSSRVSPSDTLFVFARASSGPRMPLAIIKAKVSDLPLNFTLDDSLAINPEMKLSNFSEVIVGVRVSKSGNAMPQSGDLKGSTSVIKVGSLDLKIIIDSAVP